MRSFLAVILLVLCLLPSLGNISQAEEQYRYVDLVHRLTDLEYLATLPKKGEVGAMWSSYDRSSTYDPVTNTYVNWDANGDGFGGSGYIRMEGEQKVLAEMTGPGCIWRIWSANPQDGHVKIYLDGQAEPAVDLPFKAYFDGSAKPFTRSELVYKTDAQGWNNYTPIPYQKRCKIVADADYGEFHEFTYTIFSAGTKVPTFNRELPADAARALDEINLILTRRGFDPAGIRPGEKVEKQQRMLAAGSRTKLIEITGSRAITGMIMQPALPKGVEAQRRMMRELVLTIRWDGESEPSVWCPLGDFFGTGPGVNHYRSLPMGMTSSGFYNYWYMPFANKATVEIINDGQTDRQLTWQITHALLTKPVEQYGRFHVKWHRDAFLPQASERHIDWTMLITRGCGRFVGVLLNIWNPGGGWWGEGDEKFFVDGEKFPSFYGTGSEDYFGYAWSDPTLFEQAYHNQTISEGNHGHISVNRWHISDNVPFQTSFEAYIEKYWSNERPTLYACAAYWYLAPGGKDPYTPVTYNERDNYYIRPQYPVTMAGMDVLSEPPGSISRQNMQPWSNVGTWRDDDQLWWWAEQVGGGRLRIEVTALRAGKYQLNTRLTKAPDYAIVQFCFDGERINGPLDLYHPEEAIFPPEITLGTFNIEAGKHIVEIEVVGANPQADKKYMVGIDYIDLVPVE